MNKLLKNISLVCAVALLSGCGGGGGSNSSNTSSGVSGSKGYFIDAAVKGLKYVNEDGSTGYTQADGSFNYAGGKVTFYVGDIEVGSISSLPSDNNVLLQDILNLSRTNTTDSKLLNVATFLQSLDTDDSTDTIEIGDNFAKFKGSAYNKNILDVDTVTALSDNNITKKESSVVKEHLQNSLKRYDSSQGESVAPFVRANSPTNGASEVLANEDVVIEFSENVRKDSVTSKSVVLKDAQGNPVSTKVSVNSNKVVLTPQAPLTKGARYTVEVNEGVQDYAGNQLEAKQSTSFSVAASDDTSAPTLVSAVPANNATGVALSTTAVFTFSEKMNDDTINSSNIRLTKSGDSNTIEIKIEHAKKVVKVTPLKPLDANTSYELQVSPAVADASNNTLGSLYKTSFTTGSAFVHDGFEYNIVTSPITGRKWLDRNLGAEKSCEETNDEKCYGDYYQWGRKTNGHEKKASSVSEDTLAKDVASNGKFINWNADWRSNKNDTLWSGVDAINNPCPSGFRVPLIDELLIETKYVNALQFPGQRVTGQKEYLTNFLKLPSNGFRKHLTRDGILELRAYSGGIWSSSTNDVGLSYELDYFPGGIFSTPVQRAYGKGVRCIQDYTDTVKPEVSSTTPADNATDVSINTGFRVEFSKAMISSPSRSNILLTKGGEAVAINILRNISNHIFVISPDFHQGDNGAGLSYDTEYKLTFKKELYDVAGNTMAADKVITFRTELNPELAPPKYASSLPKDNGKNASRSENIRVKFNKTLKASSVTASNVVLKKDSNVIATTVTYENNTIVVNPTAHLDANASYTLTLTTNLLDEGDRALATEKVLSFTTSDVIDIDDKYGNIYKPVVSAKTGKTWLDRNLGAIKVCEHLNDNDCYGDYFQWGRKANAHEKKTSQTSSAKLVSDVDNNGVFIARPSHGSEVLWRQSIDKTLWNTDGANNPCPTGYRVPSSEELWDEFENFSRTTLFENFLKMPVNGKRNASGSMDSSSSMYLWSNTSSSAYGHMKALANITSTMSLEDASQNSGLGLRCIKK